MNESNNNTNEKIALWEEYLHWRESLVKARVKGVKYINLDFENKYIKFYLLLDSADEVTQTIEFIKKKDINILSGPYCNNLLKYKYSDKKYNNRELIEIMYNCKVWEGSFEQYKHEYGYECKEAMTELIYNELKAPYILIIKCEYKLLDTSGKELVDKKEEFINEYNKEGFLVKSIRGELSLIKRQLEVLSDLKRNETYNNNLSKWLFDIRQADNKKGNYKVQNWFNKKINDSQKLAVEGIINSKEIYLVQGPPGTGKTTVITEAIYQLTKLGNKILLASQSNLAVDNVLQRLELVPEIRAIRLGKKKKISKEIYNFTEDNILESYYESIKNEMEKEIKEISIEDSKNSLDACDYNFKIQEVLKHLLSIEEIDPEGTIINVKEIIDRLSNNSKPIVYKYNLENELRNLYESWIDRLKSKKYLQNDQEYFINYYIKNCNVVGISCTEDKYTLLNRELDEFDIAIIDEVSKATPPELLMIMTRAKKCILVGDHRQLPPVFDEHEQSYKELLENIKEESEHQLSQEYGLLTEENYDKFKEIVTASLFENYFGNIDDGLKQPLEEQYRMHEDIMHIINSFYGGTLKCGLNSEELKKYKNHNLNILSDSGKNIINDSQHILWIDSSYDECENERFENQNDSSKENEFEAKLIIKMLNKINEDYLKQGYTEENRKEVGIISFYGSQVQLIKSEIKTQCLNALSIDINTVDGFQGKEKDIILVSLVRNTERHNKGIKGHVAAYQRINVAFSRAKQLLIIIGAKNMYERVEVELPNLNNGEVELVKVYKNIMNELDNKGLLVNCTIFQ